MPAEDDRGPWVARMRVSGALAEHEPSAGRELVHEAIADRRDYGEVRRAFKVEAVVRDPGHPKRLETSRFVLEKILPARAIINADVDIKARTLSPEAQKVIDDATVRIARLLPELKEAAARSDFMRHVKTGADALPGPVTTEPRKS